MPASVKSAERPASSMLKPRLATKSTVLDGSPTGSSPAGRGWRGVRGLRCLGFFSASVEAASPSVAAGASPSADLRLGLRYGEKQH